MIKEFPNGLTVAELKKIIADWPEIEPFSGGNYQVWIGAVKDETSLVTSVASRSGYELLFSCTQHDEPDQESTD